MKIKLIPLLLLCLISLTTGCASLENHNEILRYDNPRNEFRDKYFSINKNAYKGSYVGRLQKNGTTCYHYQFPNVLAGDHPRVLDVFIPVTYQGNAVISESSVELGEIEEAKLFSAYLHHNWNAHRDDTPKEYFGQNYPNISANADMKNAIHIKIRLHNTDTLFAEKLDSEIWFIPSIPQLDEPIWLHFDADCELNWIARKKRTSILKKMKYFYTAPFDILTLPLQIIVLPFCG